MIRAPNGVAQGVRPPDEELASVEDADVVGRGGGLTARRTGEGDAPQGGFEVVFVDGVVTRQTQRVRQVRQRVAEPKERGRDEAGPPRLLPGEPRARMVDIPLARGAPQQKDEREARADLGEAARARRLLPG